MRDRQETPVEWIGIQCVRTTTTIYFILGVYVWRKFYIPSDGNNQQTKATKEKQRWSRREEMKKMNFTAAEDEETNIYLPHIFLL